MQSPTPYIGTFRKKNIFYFFVNIKVQLLLHALGENTVVLSKKKLTGNQDAE